VNAKLVEISDELQRKHNPGDRKGKLFFIKFMNSAKLHYLYVPLASDNMCNSVAVY
jgi:hypothetical protein